MKITFEFPKEIRKFCRKEGIKLNDLKNKIKLVVGDDLLDKNYKPIKCKEIRVVINGIHKTQKNKVFISAKKISKKKPLRTVSYVGRKPDHSIYYLIFKQK